MSHPWKLKFMRLVRTSTDEFVQVSLGNRIEIHSKVCIGNMMSFESSKK